MERVSYQDNCSGTACMYRVRAARDVIHLRMNVRTACNTCSYRIDSSELINLKLSHLRLGGVSVFRRYEFWG